MSAIEFNSPRRYWFQRNEVALNWVALGMLLAAWNACDNSPSKATQVDAAGALPRRPPSLLAHAYVSVRAYKGHETVNEL